MHRPKGAAHPRSRGENPLSRAASAAEDGSSPLARGKHRRPARQPRPPGLIPARAGKTCFQRQKSSCRRAHPRSRGENSAAGRPIRTSWCSSPLTRGKLDSKLQLALCPGLIPAHAGKTTSRLGRSCSRRAHPRSRGENVVGGTQEHSIGGSSPLTRGKPSRGRCTRCCRRLIPAHAGKTGVALLCDIRYRAHPRSRGENQSHG